MSIASLGMYDEPALSPANDSLWQVVRTLFKSNTACSIIPPDKLNRIMPLDQQWNHPDLFASQTCGYPYMTSYHHTLQLVATPEYNHHGCQGPLYSSFLVTASHASSKLADYQNKILAANSQQSLSGLIALEIELANHGITESFFGHCLLSGGHVKSMRMVAEGNADLCCVDAVTWGLARDSDPKLVAQLQTIGQTPMFPSLPIVTSANRDKRFIETLQTALLLSLKAKAAQKPLQVLGISNFAQLTDDDYGHILECYAKVPATLRGKIARKYTTSIIN